MLYSAKEFLRPLPLRDHVRLQAQLQLMPALESAEEETLIGGQAVMEGVMMRAPHSYCVAVRKPDGEIITDEHPLPRLSERYPIFKLPVFRGVGTLGQAMALGVRALRFSANAALDDGNKQADGEKANEIPGWVLALNLTISFAFFIFLYKFVPLVIATALQDWMPALGGRIIFNVIDGVVRIALFVGFLLAISRWRDIRRMFEYHGAEHRVVFAFESGKPVTVEHAQTFPTCHPRCGTSFLLVVMLVSIALYTLLPFDSFVMRFAGRLALLPVVAGLSYELIRFAAKRRKSVMAMLTVPGLWLQRITTQPPSDDQTAVAIRALDGALELEKAQGGVAAIA
ncbi:MAG: DUF1385 domain-containing protein [bacterium]|jgi:uncharacterized protein YqhQ